MAHLHRQAEAGAPVRQVTGDGRSRYPRTVITTNSRRMACHHDVTRAGDNLDAREGSLCGDGSCDLRRVPKGGFRDSRVSARSALPTLAS